MTFRPDAARCPVRGHTPPLLRPLPIHGPAFDADPEATYRRLRAHGPVVWVEISPGVFGYLAVTYAACLHLLRNPERFRKDPTGNWEALGAGVIPADSPALQMMMPRDNALWKDGEEHRRLREAITTALSRVDTRALAGTVTRIADQLIDAFCETGKADLVASYTDPLPMLTVTSLFGSPPQLSEKIVHYVTRVFAAGSDAAQANAALESACLELVGLKRHRPGRDLVTYLIEAGLTDEELVQTILLIKGAAAPPTAKHTAAAIQLILTSERFAGNVHTGVTPVSAALEEVLWTRPPAPNYHPVFAQGPQQVEGVTVQPGHPILVSYAAANTDPAVAVPGAERAGNRGHLAFSAGPHACPAPDLARGISSIAVERLLDRLPDLRLAIPAHEVPALPGTFLAGPAALPVHFHPSTTGKQP
ncbi:cytochrome P450 [Streptomyces sp. NPDC048717]|uniref:cytochrome P450 n=1 Tax=Streptomyces sp. NPDC048717 TaxID=3154928 RepID=UPI003417D870